MSARRPRRGAHRARALAAAVLSVASALAAAAPPTLDLGEALGLALERSPRLAAFPASLRAAEARVRQAGRRPNPVVGLEVEGLGEERPALGVSGAELTLALSQRLELGGDARRRAALAATWSAETTVEYERARLTLARDVVLAFAEGLAAAAERDIARRALDAANRLRAAAERRREAGAAPSTEVDRIALAAGRAALEVAGAEAAVAAARARLGALWDTAPDRLPPLAGDLARLPALPELGRWITTALEQAPALRLAGVRTRSHEALAALERARGRADLTLSLGLRAREGTDAEGLVLGVERPLQLFDRNVDAVDAAGAEADAERARAGAERASLVGELHAAHVRLDADRRRAEALADRLVPRADALLEATRRRYADGRADLLEVLDALAQRTALERDLVTVRHRYVRRFAETEAATGSALDAGAIARAGAGEPEGALR
jgi:cobalt-zinc-cadmium efflux system outer membrane protein